MALSLYLCQTPSFPCNTMFLMQLLFLCISLPQESFQKEMPSFFAVPGPCHFWVRSTREKGNRDFWELLCIVHICLTSNCKYFSLNSVLLKWAAEQNSSWWQKNLALISSMAAETVSLAPWIPMSSRRESCILWGRRRRIWRCFRS